MTKLLDPPTADTAAPEPVAGRRGSTGLVRSTLLVSSFAGALVVTIVVAAFVGTANIGAADVLGIILRHLRLGGLAPVPAPSPLIDALIWESRLPRVLLAGVIGLGLSVCGAVLQSITRNPLAEPYLLGVSSGASTGAVSVMILGLGSGAVTLSVGAFAGALSAFAIVLLLIGGGRVSNPARVVLTAYWCRSSSRRSPRWCSCSTVTRMPPGPSPTGCSARSVVRDGRR